MQGENTQNRRQAQPEVNRELEIAVVGGVLANNESIELVGPILEPEHFGEPFLGALYQHARTRIENGETVSPITIAHDFKDSAAASDMAQDGDAVPGMKFYVGMVANAPPRIAMESYARQLVGLHERRRVIRVTEDLRAALGDTAGAPNDVVTAAIDQLLDGGGEDVSAVSRSRKAEDIAEAIVDRVNLAFQEGKPQKTVLETGLSDLDRFIGGGWHLKKMIILGARPGMGKTAVAVSLATRTAGRGHGVAYFSLEMPDEELVERALADAAFTGSAPIPYREIHNDKLDAFQIERIVEAQSRFTRLPLEIDDTSELTLARLRARLQGVRRRFQQQGQQLRLVIVDYLQLMTASERYFGQRTQEVAELSKGLKQIAKDFNVCVIALSQLSRQLESRTDKRPMLSDLRESGSLEQDADIVLFLYRDHYYKVRELEEELRNADVDPGTEAEARAYISEIEKVIEFIFAKNRQGPTASRQFFLDIACNALRNLEEGRTA